MLQTKENYISHEHTNVQEMLKSFIQAFVKWMHLAARA